MKIVIYLIEDNIADHKKILREINAYLNDRYRNEEYSFEFKSLEGTVEKKCREKDWKFYEPGVIDTIRDKMAEEQLEGNKMGLLLDVLLTEEDLEYSLSKYYAKATIARDIYFEFNQVIPIYIITSILNFGTQSDIIMGVDLRDSYILKTCLDYPEDVFMEHMFERYIQMIK